MYISDLFIKRPVLAFVVSALIVTSGVIALSDLAVRELPDVDASVVSISTRYTGAAPSIIDTEITEVIEGAVAQVDGVKNIQSISREGSGRTTVIFDADKNIDAAAADLRDAVGEIQGDLPLDAGEPSVVKADTDSQPIMRLSLISPNRSPSELTDLAERVVVDRLSTVTGVGDVEINGQRRYAIRIWLDSGAMAARNLSVTEVQQALRRANIELPSGRLESSQRQLMVRTDTRLRDLQAFRDLTIAESGGYPIRLSEIARVEYGVEDDSTRVRFNGSNSVNLSIIRQSKANTLAVSSGIRAEVERIRSLLPEDVEFIVATDDADFIQASVNEVIKTLLIAVAVVVLVIFSFLYSVKATLIPAITIPVAVIGSFILISALGFSVNLLTLLALILAIGLVVDDAIVVLENAQRRVDHGEQSLAAAYLGTRQVTFAVLATSAVLIAVYVPLSMLGGDVGKLFREFGLVLAAAVVISTLVALSLTPMLCSQMLGRSTQANLATRIAERCFNALEHGYRRLLAFMLRMPIVVITVALLLSTTSILLYQSLPQELVPKEDRSVFFISARAPEGATLDYTDTGIRKIEETLQPLLDNNEARRIVSIVGSRNRPNRAFVVIGLNLWDQRERNQQEIVQSLRRELGAIPDLRAVPISRSTLGRNVGRQGIRFVIGGPNYESAREWSEAIVAKARENPGLTDLDTDYESKQPTLQVEIDRAMADQLGVPVERIASTLQTMLASREVTTYIDRGREYAVIIQAENADRRSPQDLQSFFVRADKSGQLVPMSAVVKLSESTAPLELRRFDRLPSITVEASLAGGYDLGKAIAYLQRIAKEELPIEASTGFRGSAQVFLETTGSLYFVFVVALLVVFLVLAAQFENFAHPFVILLTVPVGITGALLALAITGNSINLYSQIGCVLLIGLMAKNGILIVEFANQFRAQGLTLHEAILDGASQRLRPILMTALSTILGALPLALASGAGAESRTAIGVVVIGGLGLSTLITLFLTPVLYELMGRFTRPVNAMQQRLGEQLAQAEAARAVRQ